MVAPSSSQREDDDDDDKRIKVFLRLRPMNKLEQAKRSKDCVELHDDPKLATVDSPIHGEHNFECDMVFDEYASQQEVCQEVSSGIPQKLLDGINCTLLAFGQTGTGKTHTMIGAGNGTEVNALSKSLSNMAEASAATNSNSMSSLNNLSMKLGGSSSNMNFLNLSDDEPELTEEEAMKEAGIVPKVVEDIFASLKTATTAPSVEYTIRVSFVELYLEQVRDLLKPHEGSSDDGARIGKDDNGDVCVVGASELCCVTPADVYALLARGIAQRTQSATLANVDSSRSHAVVTIRVEQLDRETGRQHTARLQLLDLAGSEWTDEVPPSPVSVVDDSDNRDTNELGDASLHVEGKMINQSLACLSNLIRAELLLQEQKRSKQRPSLAENDDEPEVAKPTPRLVHPNKFAKASKLSKLLQPAFGGNSCTRVICTASPSSYSINETLGAIRFAQRVQKIRNQPFRQERLAIHEYRKRLAQSDRRVDGLSELAKSLARECFRIQPRIAQQNQAPKMPQPQDDKDSSSSSDSNDSSDSSEESAAAENDTTEEITNKTALTATRDPRLWGIIEQVVSELDENKDNDVSDLEVHVVRKSNSLGDSTSPTLNDDQQRNRIEILEHQVKEAELAREKAEASLHDVQSEVVSLRSQTELLTRVKYKMERDLNDAKSEIRILSSRKSEVEHNLRTSQFRESEAVGFLRQFRSFYIRLLKNKAAHGNGDATQLAEDVISKIPGVPELEDLFDIDSLMMASGLIEEDEIGEDINTAEYLPSKEALSRSASEALQAEQREVEMAKSIEKQQLSIASRQEPVQHTTYRQKLVQTPAGLLAMKKEKEMERNLAELSTKNVSLQNAVNAEKAMIEAMSSRQGALNKMKAAQELSLMRQELERKTNDLQAIVWKMNEVHLVNKIIEERVEDREFHVGYLEEHLVDLQTRNRRLVIERQDTERKLRDEGTYLRKQLEGMSRSLWQLGERASKQMTSSRLLVPFSVRDDIDSDEFQTVQRRKSLGELAEEMLAPEIPVLMTSSAQTELVLKTTTGMQTDEPEEPEMEKPPLPDPKEEEENMEEDEKPEVETTLSAECGTQTDEIEKEQEKVVVREVAPPPKEMATTETQTDAEDSGAGVEISTQTETDEERKDSEMQTDGDATIDGGDEAMKTPSIPEPQVKESADMNTQTDEVSRMNFESIEISTQTTEGLRSIPESADMTTQTTLDETSSTEVAIQTEEIEIKSEPAETVIAEIQTDPIPTLFAAEPKETTTMSTQTDTRRKFEIGTQTILDSSSIRAAIISPSAESATQTDAVESRISGSSTDLMERGIQTDLEPALPTKLCYDAGVQTDQTPNVIAVGGGRSVGSVSLDDPTAARRELTKSASASALRGTGVASGWSGNSSQASSEFFVDSKTNDTAFAVNDRWIEKKAMMGYDDNQFAASFSGITGIKEKFEGGTSANGPRYGGTVSASIASPKTIEKGASRSVEAASSSNPSMPEWMSKRRQMGIKDTKSAEGAALAGGTNVTSSNSRSLRHSNNTASAESHQTASPVLASSSSSTKPEWMQRLKQNAAKIEGSQITTTQKALRSPPPAPKPTLTSPEWMIKAKKMQSKEQASSAATTSHTFQPAKTASPSEAGVQNTPEWMKKFQQMGTKENSDSTLTTSTSANSLLKGGKPADFEPRRFVDKYGNAVIPGVTHDEDELERMRKEEKKARKKAKKKARKEAERNSGYHNI